MNFLEFYFLSTSKENKEEIDKPFEVIFTNNPLVQQLFTNLSDKEIREIPLVEREELSGKSIREKMTKGKSWKEFLPEVILPLVEKYNGAERIQALAKTDDKR